ncbi:MAG: 50S ribosomal protein L32e [Methanoregula sp.]|jgi:large subunit ribosomal protein L32e|uniref:50S ribosomal protein L32e n=1 Tax=Methanoregula sp. TaxID=2052170 RepID=UPI003C70EF11
MTTETKRLIRVRTEKGAVFKRDGFGKKKQLSDSWRKPRGQHNKQREQKKAKGALPKPGYGSPVAVRGMHPSGFFEVLVFTEKDLENLDTKTQAIRISAGVGGRNRKALQEKATEAGFKILNVRVIKAPVKKETPAESEKDAAKDKKETKAKEAPAKKSASKAGDAKKKGAEEKKPVKTTSSKSKPAAKETAKKEEKAAKPKAKEAAKAPAKKAAPLKSEKKPADGEKAPAEKAKAKKKSSSEVKKNE